MQKTLLESYMLSFGYVENESINQYKEKKSKGWFLQWYKSFSTITFDHGCTIAISMSIHLSSHFLFEKLRQKKRKQVWGDHSVKN